MKMPESILNQKIKMLARTYVCCLMMVVFLMVNMASVLAASYTGVVKDSCIAAKFFPDDVGDGYEDDLDSEYSGYEPFPPPVPVGIAMENTFDIAPVRTIAASQDVVRKGCGNALVVEIGDIMNEIACKYQRFLWHIIALYVEGSDTRDKVIVIEDLLDSLRAAVTIEDVGLGEFEAQLRLEPMTKKCVAFREVYPRKKAVSLFHDMATLKNNRFEHLAGSFVLLEETAIVEHLVKASIRLELYDVALFLVQDMVSVVDTQRKRNTRMDNYASQFEGIVQMGKVIVNALHDVEYAHGYEGFFDLFGKERHLTKIVLATFELLVDEVSLYHTHQTKFEPEQLTDSFRFGVYSELVTCANVLVISALKHNKKAEAEYILSRLMTALEPFNMHTFFSVPADEVLDEAYKKLVEMHLILGIETNTISDEYYTRLNRYRKICLDCAVGTRASEVVFVQGIFMLFEAAMLTRDFDYMQQLLVDVTEAMGQSGGDRLSVTEMVLLNFMEEISEDIACMSALNAGDTQRAQDLLEQTEHEANMVFMPFLRVDNCVRVARTLVVQGDSTNAKRYFDYAKVVLDMCANAAEEARTLAAHTIPFQGVDIVLDTDDPILQLRLHSRGQQIDRFMAQCYMHNSDFYTEDGKLVDAESLLKKMLSKNDFSEGDTALYLAVLPKLDMSNRTAWIIRYIMETLRTGHIYEDTFFSSFSFDDVDTATMNELLSVIKSILALDAKTFTGLVRKLGLNAELVSGQRRRDFNEMISRLFKGSSGWRDVRIKQWYTVTLLDAIENDRGDIFDVLWGMQSYAMCNYDAQLLVGVSLFGNACEGVGIKSEKRLSRIIQDSEPIFQTYAAGHPGFAVEMELLAKAREAEKRFDFKGAVSLYDTFFEHEESIHVFYAKYRQTLMKKDHTFGLYIHGKDDAAKKILQGLRHADPSAGLLEDYFQKVSICEAFSKCGLFDRAKRKISQIKAQAYVNDQRLEALFTDITAKENRVEEFTKLVSESRIDQALVSFDTLVADGFIGESVCVDGERLAQLFYDRADEYMLPFHLYKKNDYFIVQHIASSLLTVVRQRENAEKILAATMVETQGTQNEKQKKKGKKSQQNKQPTKFRLKRVVNEPAIKTLGDKAHAKGILEKLSLDEKMLEQLVLSEKALISEMGGGTVAVNDDTDTLSRAQLSYQMLLPASDEANSCDITFVGKMRSPDTFLNLSGDMFQVGDHYVIYDTEGNPVNRNTLFQLTEKDVSRIRFRISNEGNKTDDACQAILEALPRQGRIERIPQSTYLKQWKFIKDLRGKLAATIDTDLPQTGNSLVDTFLGLVVEGNNKELLVLGPAGSGKTSGVILSALSLILDTDETKSFGVHYKQLDAFQKDAVDAVVKKVTVKHGPYMIRICSKTNDAVDVIGEQLYKAGVPFIRLGNMEDSINKSVLPVWTQKTQLIEDAPEVFNNGQSIIVLTTIDSMTSDTDYRNSPFFNRTTDEDLYDITIGDEWPMLTWSETLLACQNSRGLIGIGDWTQLRSLGVTEDRIKDMQHLLGRHKYITALFNEENRNDFSVSPFEVFFKQPHDGIERKQLAILRRFSRPLVEVVVKKLYDRFDIEVYPDKTKSPIPDPEVLVVSESGGHEGIFEDNDTQHSYCNVSEAEEVVQHIDYLLTRPDEKGGPVHLSDVKVITYYKPQVTLIKVILRIKAVLNEYADAKKELIERDRANLERDIRFFFSAIEHTDKTIGNELERLQRQRENLRAKGGHNFNAGSRFIDNKIGYLLGQKAYFKKKLLRQDACLAQVKDIYSYEDIRRLLSDMPLNGKLFPQNKKLYSSEQLKRQDTLVTSVDGSQGSENKVVIVSTVRSNTRNDIGFLSNWNRLLVSLTRMKRELHLIGNFRKCLSQANYYVPVKKLQDDPRRLARELARQEEVVTARNLFAYLPQAAETLSRESAMYAGVLFPQETDYDDVIEDATRGIERLIEWTYGVSGSIVRDNEATGDEYFETLGFVCQYLIPAFENFGDNSQDVFTLLRKIDAENNNVPVFFHDMCNGGYNAFHRFWGKALPLLVLLSQCDSVIDTHFESVGLLRPSSAIPNDLFFFMKQPKHQSTIYTELMSA